MSQELHNLPRTKAVHMNVSSQEEKNRGVLIQDDDYDSLVRGLFKNIQEFDPPRGLESRIMRKIAFENKRLLIRKRTLVRGGMLVSLFFSVYGGLYFGSALLESDFLSLVKLMFSDGAVVASFWKNFILSLLETFPVLYAIAVLVPVFALLILASLYSKLSNLNNKNHYTTHYLTT